MRRSMFVSMMLLTIATAFGQLKVSLNMNSHPDPYLSHWPDIKNTVIVTITNASAKSIEAKFDSKISRDGVLIASTKPESMRTLTIAPGVTQFYGETLVPFDAVKFFGDADKIAIKTGMLAAGAYEFCVGLLDSKTNQLITTPVCKNFAMVSYQAPVLMQPEDGSTIDKGKRPLLKWVAVSPAMKKSVSYRVQVFEVLAGQTPVTAFRVNRPILDRSVAATQLMWPADAEPLQEGRRYVWSVQALDEQGNAIGENNGTATPFTFVMCCVPDTSGNDDIADTQGGMQSAGHTPCPPMTTSTFAQVLELLNAQFLCMFSNQPTQCAHPRVVQTLDMHAVMWGDGWFHYPPVYNIQTLNGMLGGVYFEALTHLPLDAHGVQYGFIQSITVFPAVLTPSTNPTSVFDATVTYAVCSTESPVHGRIKLVSTPQLASSGSTGLHFAWEMEGAEEDVSYTLHIAQSSNKPDSTMAGNVVVVWPMNFVDFYQQNRITEQSFDYADGKPLLVTDQNYCWFVSAENAHGQEIARSDYATWRLAPIGESLARENSNVSIDLISPNESSSNVGLHPTFVFQPLSASAVQSYSMRLFKGIIKEQSLYFDTIKPLFAAGGLTGAPWRYPTDAPPLDTQSYYAWQVQAIGGGNHVLGTSALRGFAVSGSASTGPSLNPNCMCALSMIGAVTDVTVCTVTAGNPPFPLYWGSFIGGPCTAPTNVWSGGPNPIPNTPGTYTYTCQVTRSGVSCSYPVVVHVYTPSSLQGIVICPDANNSYTECCAPPQKFKLKLPGCATALSGFPNGTTYHWYIIASGGTPPIPLGTESAYPIGNPCWNGGAFAAVSGWHSIGNGTSATAGGSLPVSSLPSGHYYVACLVSFPGGTFNCMSGGCTPFYDFTVVPNTTPMAANLTVTPPTCADNGVIAVGTVTGGTGPYTYACNLSSGPSQVPVFGTASSWTGLPTAVHYYVRIRDAHGCIAYFTGPFQCIGCPPGPGITSLVNAVVVPNTHTIPCPPGTLQLTLSSTASSTSSYQWMRCANCGSCNALTTCSLANCPLGSYAALPPAGILSGPLTTPGCYRLRVTDANGHCTFSVPWFVYAQNPGPVISGSIAICDTVHILTLSATGTNLQWSFNGAPIPGATGSPVTFIVLPHPPVAGAITLPTTLLGTFSVTSTSGTCTSPASSITVTGYPCHACWSCNYTIDNIGVQPNVSAGGAPNYTVTLHVSNGTVCPGSLGVQPQPGEGTVLATASAMYPVTANGTTIITFDISTAVPSGHQANFTLPVTLPVGMCTLPFSITIP